MTGVGPALDRRCFRQGLHLQGMGVAPDGSFTGWRSLWTRSRAATDAGQDILEIDTARLHQRFERRLPRDCSNLFLPIHAIWILLSLLSTFWWERRVQLRSLSRSFLRLTEVFLRANITCCTGSLTRGYIWGWWGCTKLFLPTHAHLNFAIPVEYILMREKKYCSGRWVGHPWDWQEVFWEQISRAATHVK